MQNNSRGWSDMLAWLNGETNQDRRMPLGEFLPKRFDVAEKPTDGKAFKVDLKTIDLSFFVKERSDKCQEETRKIILEAISIAVMQPEDYELFYLLIPEKKWVYGDKGYANREELMNFAQKVGGSTTILVEEALGWAQRISNDKGSDESWKDVCNNPDKTKYRRLIIGKDGKPCLVGNASEFHYESSASNIIENDEMGWMRIVDVVPSVTIKSLYGQKIFYFLK